MCLFISLAVPGLSCGMWDLLIIPQERERKKVRSLSCVQLFATLWTVASQASPSMGFSRQEYWSGLPFPSPGDLPNPAIKPGSPALEADALTSEPPGKPSIYLRPIILRYIFPWGD